MARDRIRKLLTAVGSGALVGAVISGAMSAAQTDLVDTPDMVPPSAGVVSATIADAKDALRTGDAALLVQDDADTTAPATIGDSEDTTAKHYQGCRTGTVDLG